MVHLLKNKLEEHNVSVLEINMYDLSLDLLKEENILDQIPELEADEDIRERDILDLLRETQDPGKKLMPLIEKRRTAHPHQLLFLTGLGEVWPWINPVTLLGYFQDYRTDSPHRILSRNIHTQQKRHQTEPLQPHELLLLQSLPPRGTCRRTHHLSLIRPPHHPPQFPQSP
jgi:hypothetical protein